MTGCRAQNIGNAFVLAHFSGRATIGGSPATGNTFVNSDGGLYFDLDGATIQESYDSVQADATSGGLWADWFGNDTAASHPSTVVLTNNTIAVNGQNFSGIGVWLNYNAAPNTPRDTMLHLTVAHNTVTIGGDGTDYAIYAQDTTEIVISDNTISGAGDRRHPPQGQRGQHGQRQQPHGLRDRIQRGHQPQGQDRSRGRSDPCPRHLRQSERHRRSTREPATQ